MDHDQKYIAFFQLCVYPVHMKLYSWNVNGIRACMQKGFAAFIEQEDPDILCLQEIKAEEKDFELSLPSYRKYINSAEKKGYSGTAILTKVEPIRVSFGIGIEEHDREGRVITAEFDDFFLVCAYIPNSQRELARLDYRMTFDEAFRNYVSRLNEEKGVIICGDLNVAHKEIDIKNPKSNIRNAGFTIEERESFQRLLDRGFIDSFRYFHPDEKDAYTWWSYMFKARERNAGWRIDYFVVSKDLEKRMKDAFICSQYLGSDHCPVCLAME